MGGAALSAVRKVRATALGGTVYRAIRRRDETPVVLVIPPADCRECGGTGMWWTGSRFVAKNCRVCRGTGVQS